MLLVYTASSVPSTPHKRSRASTRRDCPTNVVGEEKRRAISYLLLRGLKRRVLKTLVSPKKLDELLFDEFVDLAKHFKLKPSPIVKRFKFNSRRQKEGESIAVCVAELRKIAEHCEYGAVLNDMLCDRLVCGTCN